MNEFKILQQIIRARRSVKPGLMNGRQIADSVIQQLLELADWAPTHGYTEPWRFVVYKGDALDQFCTEHAELYKKVTPPEKFNITKYEKLKQSAGKLSHLVIVYLKRAENSKIPVLEEIAAVAASVQNILLGATALGIASMWSTGGVTHQPVLKTYLGLQENDLVMGLLHFGYADEIPEGKRMVPLSEKIIWK
ncbi:MAG TPA: nitroreductase [Chitinophagaceae bacterium]